MEVLRLAEDQNARFDTEDHSAEELGDKIERVHKLLGREPRRILDIGGGNGRFLDAMLDAFPEAEGVNIDISKLLLDANRPHPRKTVIHGAIESTPLPGTFDLITINFVLHHMVGRSYSACRRNCMAILAACRDALSPNGLIVVAEIMYDGVGDIPGRMIYNITRINNPLVTPITRKFFNTAGVGVCFRSERAWRQLFGQVLHTRERALCTPWPMTVSRFLLLIIMMLRRQRHAHFYLTSPAVAPGAPG